MAIRRDESRFAGDRPADLSHVETPVRVARESMWSAEAAGRARVGTADAREHDPVAVEDTDAARQVALDRPEPERALSRSPSEPRDVHLATRENDLRGTLDLGDLSHEPTLGSEDLDAVALAIAHQHVSVRSDGNPVRQHELTGPGTRFAPRPEELPRRREMVHARVSVPVGDVQVTVWRDREVRRAIEGRSASGNRRDVRAVVPAVGGFAGVVAEGKQQLAVGRELAHRVTRVVRAPHRVVRSDRDAVRAHREDPLAPRPDEASVALVDKDGMVSAAEEIDAPFGINRDRGDVGMRVAGRELLPTGYCFVDRR